MFDDPINENQHDDNVYPTLISVGGVGLNLKNVVAWEWHPEHSSLVIHTTGKPMYLQGEQARDMSETLAGLASTSDDLPEGGLL